MRQTRRGMIAQSESLPKKDTLNNMSWADIRTVIDAGQAANYWAVGDRKAVTLNGIVGLLTFNNLTIYCYILGFDHNSAIEGANKVHFGFGFTALTGGVHVGFVDGNYGTTAGGFRINSIAINTGGWNGSFMHNIACPAFKDVLPLDLQSVLKTVIKYTDNIGDGNSQVNTITATTDTIFLLSEYEVQGVRKYANDGERNYQKQYQYFVDGNNKIKYRHNATGSTAIWWLRSPAAQETNTFCVVNTDGSTNTNITNRSYAFAPAFCV